MTIHTLLLVRHGEASASWGDHIDPGLSKNGLKQANNLIQFFSNEDLSSFDFFSSPKARAIETSTPLAKSYKKHVIVNKRFSEIPSENIPNNKKQGWLKEIMLQDQSALPVMVKDWREKIFEELFLIKNNAIIFSHFMVINAITSSILNSPNLLYFYPDYTSCTKIIFENNEIKEIVLGDDKKTLINL